MPSVVPALAILFATSAAADLDPALCENSLRERSLEEAQAIAEPLLRAIETAVANVEATYGEDIWESPHRGRLPTPDGEKNLGTIFRNYLTEAGYPASFAQARACAGVLARFDGFDGAAETIIAMPVSNIDWVDHASASLRVLLAK